MKTDDDKLSAVDREALKRALALAKAEDAGRRKQLERMQHEDGWLEAAHFAAYHCQIRSLRLRPWENPPVYGHLNGDMAAANMLQRLLAHGLSRFEPDPIAALVAVSFDEPPAAA